MRWPSALDWMDKGVPLSPVVRLRIAWVTLVLSVVGLAASLLLMEWSDPMLVLTLVLSWLAITFTAADLLMTADVRKQQEGD